MAHALWWNLMTVLLSVQGLLIKSLVPLFRLFLAFMQTTNSCLLSWLPVIVLSTHAKFSNHALLFFLLLSQWCFILSICVTNTHGSLWLQEIGQDQFNTPVSLPECWLDHLDRQALGLKSHVVMRVLIWIKPLLFYNKMTFPSYNLNFTRVLLHSLL